MKSRSAGSFSETVKSPLSTDPRKCSRRHKPHRGARVRIAAIGRRNLPATCVSLVLACLVLAATTSAARKRDKPILITTTKLDPNAEKVKFFDGLKKGTLQAVLIPKDETGGQVLLQNKSDKPLTVQLPEAIVGVQVLKQFGAGAGGLGGVGGLGGQGGLGGGGGQSQPLGGGMGGMGMGGMGGMGMGGMGGGFFSIPPEKVFRVPCRSVCLAHGKPTPNPKMRYRLVQVDEYTSDRRLQELLKLIAKHRINQRVAQAAAWHLTDNMSWRELALKRVDRLGGLPSTPYFAPAHLVAAQRLVAMAAANAKKTKNTESTGDSAHQPTPTPKRTRRIR